MNTDKKNEELLNKLFNLIGSSDTPEFEAEYLAEEFGFKADELFLLYLNHSKNCLPYSQLKDSQSNFGSQLFNLDAEKPRVSIVDFGMTGLDQGHFAVEHGNKNLVAERRRSSPVERLRYGLLKSIDKLYESNFSSDSEDKVIICTKAYIVNELMKYEVRSTPSSVYSSIFDYLASIKLNQCEIDSKLSREKLIATLVRDIQANFEVFNIPRVI